MFTCACLHIQIDFLDSSLWFLCLNVQKFGCWVLSNIALYLGMVFTCPCEKQLETYTTVHQQVSFQKKLPIFVSSVKIISLVTEHGRTLTILLCRHTFVPISTRWAMQCRQRRVAEPNCIYPPSSWLAKLSADVTATVPWIFRVTPSTEISIPYNMNSITQG